MMIDKLSRIVLLYSTFALASLAQAESVYIKDTLRVGVRPEPRNDVASIGVVVTGMQLEVIERRGKYLLIRTDKGLQGWIKSTYASNTPPAKAKLAALQKEYESLKSRLGQGEHAAKNAESSNKALLAEIENLKKSNNELRQALAENRPQSSANASTSFWELSTYILLSLLGFTIGVIWYRHQAMKRLGGLRV